LSIAAVEFTDLLSDDVRFAQGVIRTLARNLRESSAAPPDRQVDPGI